MKPTARSTALAMLAIMALGLAVRVWQLPNESPWWDEIVCLRHLSAPSLVSFISGVRHDDPPMTPGYFTAAYAWACAISPSVISMRYLSVFLAVTTMPLLYAFTRMLYGVSAGLIATLAFSLSMVHVYFSQEVRTYSFVTFFALLSAYALARALREDRRAWWITHLVVNALLTFTHLFATILFGVEGLLLLCVARTRPRAVSIWFGLHLLYGALLAAWLHSIDLGTVHEAANWMVTPGWREALVALNVFAGGRASNENPAAHMPTGVSFDWVFAGLVYGVVAWFAITRLRDRTNRREALTAAALLAWAVIPLGVLAVASYVWRPCFVYRYVLYSSLPVCVLFGAGVAALPRRWLRYTLPGCFAVLALHQASAVLAGPFRADWHGVGTYLAERLKNEDRIIVFQSLNRTSLEFNVSLPPDQVGCVEVWSSACDAIMEGLAKGGSVWFAVWLWTPPSKFETCFKQNGLTVESVDFKGWPNVRLFRITRPTTQ